ncbi:MAG: DUF1080 domain-containing protein [Candidatus Poribacteria bacterium]|nr:DUF1080 domain-containing protein [Candidatus Poribacteria bacterium]
MASNWINLFNGNDLTGWRLRYPEREHKWIVRDGVLINESKGVDLITEKEFGDFDLHLEYMMPTDSNSGIYVRGRYEIQMLDSYGKTYDTPSMNGAIYRVKSPDVEVTKPAREWQTLDITMVGVAMTVRLNGSLIHDAVELKGPTGSNWLWNDNVPRGPHFIQGDHGPVHLRDIRYRER